VEKKAIDISRRGFLTLLGAGGAGVAAGGISGCSETGIADFLQLAEPETKAPKGPEKSVTSVCGQCDGGCSIRVRTVGDRAVSLTGNPLYPLNRNGVCPRGLASLPDWEPAQTCGRTRRGQVEAD
jgi:anaerobic selenocysteine-containing dehydrogenase